MSSKMSGRPGLDSVCRLCHKSVMGNGKRHKTQAIRTLIWMAVWTGLLGATVLAADLDEVRGRGVLRHLAVPYARFVTGSGDGLDVELIQLFAEEIGVAYEWVPTTWKAAFGDLTGQDIRSGQTVTVRGDILASGLTMLPWREKQVLFSLPTFASQIWIIARADYSLAPILPGKDTLADIRNVQALVKGQQVIGISQTCLDPALYGLDRAGARIRYFDGRLNELVPAVINQEADLTLQDAPDALVSLEKWPGQIKVIGPVSTCQRMGAAMDKNAGTLKTAFDLFFEKLWHEGRYQELVDKYYPGYATYFPDFFLSPEPPEEGAAP